MTRLFLAAGVAALAIAAPASAGPGGHGGGPPAAAPHGGGGGGGGHGGGGGGGHGQAFMGGGGGGHGGGGGFVAFRGGGHGGGGGFAGFHGGGGGHGQAFMRPFGGRGGGGGHGQSFARAYGGHGGGHGLAAFQGHGGGRRAFAAHGGGHAQRFAQQRGGHGQAFAHQQIRGGGHGGRQAFAHQQVRGGHGQQQAFAREQVRGGHGQQQALARQQALAHGQFGNGHAQGQAFANQQFRGHGQERLNQQMAVNDRTGGHELFNGSRFAALNHERVLDPAMVDRFVGVPVNRVESFAALSPLPPAISYLYPETPDYYYRYGDGYLYEINRSDNVIAALLPLMAGGYLPGQYLPDYYMASYVPDYYGFNAFYPDYGDDCHRYGYGVVYEVDCFSGMVEDVIPLYAGGYGVGQLLPSAYNYYNVPMQYRPLYYDTADYGYWYAPGAIYQYEPRTSMITSVAALLSPGFTIGQPLPVGYGVYNVPYAYRATYYDTPTAWYRYNNGYIYQVDPATQLVTAIVASILT